MQSLSSKASASNVYATGEITTHDMIYDNALYNKADKATSYTGSGIMALIETLYTFTF